MQSCALVYVASLQGSRWISPKELSPAEIYAVDGLWHLLKSFQGEKTRREYNGVILSSNSTTSRVVMNRDKLLEVPNENVCVFAVPRIPTPPSVVESEVCVLCGDASDVIRSLDKTKKFRMAITSPPYREGERYSTLYQDYPDNDSPAEYIAKRVDHVKALDEFMEEEGVIVMNLSYFNKARMLHLETAVEIMRQTGWVGQQLMWKKPKAMPIPQSITRIVESIFVFARKNEYLDPRQDTTPWYESVGFSPIQFNLIKTKRNRDAYRIDPEYKNDATFPEELVECLFATYCEPGDRVIDPYCGTGTVGIVCRRVGIHATLIDQSQAACNSVRRTIQSARQCLVMDSVCVTKQAMILNKMVERASSGREVFAIQKHSWIGRRVARVFEDDEVYEGTIICPDDDKNANEEEQESVSGVYHLKDDTASGVRRAYLRVLFDDGMYHDLDFEEAWVTIRLYNRRIKRLRMS